MRVVREWSRTLLEHPVVRTLLFERFLITASATLALSALAMGRVRPSEIVGLMDFRILTLFLVLTIAVELGKASDLFDRLVVVVLRGVRSERALALGLVVVTGALAAVLTNDVALFLVVPFTMLFRTLEARVLTRLAVLEVLAANLLGALTPVGSPQNLFLFARGSFSFGSFVATQGPLVAVSAALLAGTVFLFVPRRGIAPPEVPRFDVDPRLASGFLVLFVAEAASLFGGVPHLLPLALAAPCALLLGRRLRDVDFSIVLVFALLFIGIPGLERGSLYQHLNPERIFGHHAVGLFLSGASLSQFVSNVPAALLLAPAAGTDAGFRGLLLGVTVGACGSPVASLANLIGGQIYVSEGGSPGAYWSFFCSVSLVFLVVLVLFSLLLLG